MKLIEYGIVHRNVSTWVAVIDDNNININKIIKEILGNNVIVHIDLKESKILLLGNLNSLKKLKTKIRIRALTESEIKVLENPLIIRVLYMVKKW